MATFHNTCRWCTSNFYLVLVLVLGFGGLKMNLLHVVETSAPSPSYVGASQTSCWSIIVMTVKL